MSSVRMHAVALYVRVTFRPVFATAGRTRRRLDQPKEPADPPARLRARHRVERREVEGFDCWTITPRRPSGRAALYLHGGAYVDAIRPQHWQLVGRLADAGVRVEVPLYGLAPQHDVGEAYPFLTEVYRRLVAEVAAERVGLAGDSAGGGLALGLTQTLPGSGLPLPGRLVLIAPWLDLTLDDPATAAAEAADPWLARAGLVEAGLVWAAGLDPRDPRLSPLFGPLAGLPPMELYVGTRDLGHPDAVRLSERATAAGVRLDLVACPGAVHDYPLTPTPEGRAAARRIVATLAQV